MARTPLPGGGTLARMTRLMDDVAVLKRVRRSGCDLSGAERLFRSAWAALVAGAPETDVATGCVAAALAGARLGPIDAATLASLGVPAGPILEAALRQAGPDIAATFAPGLAMAWPDAPVPPFVDALCRQPRAGATRPGHHRLVILPAESHGDHCLLVAVGGVLLADAFAADQGAVFLAGLAHHLHNARLPDAGFEGEMLLGDELAPLVARLVAAELATLPPALAQRTRAALDRVRDDTTPEGRAFHAADVLDRVLQVRYHAAAAAFRAEQALDDMELVHPGPVQAFHTRILRDAGFA